MEKMLEVQYGFVQLYEKKRYIRLLPREHINNS